MPNFLYLLCVGEAGSSNGSTFTHGEESCNGINDAGGYKAVAG